MVHHHHIFFWIIFYHIHLTQFCYIVPIRQLCVVFYTYCYPFFPGGRCHLSPLYRLIDPPHADLIRPFNLSLKSKSTSCQLSFNSQHWSLQGFIYTNPSPHTSEFVTSRKPWIEHRTFNRKKVLNMKHLQCCWLTDAYSKRRSFQPLDPSII